MEIHNILEKERCLMSSRSFMLGGMEMSVKVVKSYQEVGVGLKNCSQEDVVTSVTFKEASGWEDSWEMEKIERKKLKWASKSLSLGAVLKLEVTVTLHTER